MVRFRCFAWLLGRKKKNKGNEESAETVRHKGMNSAHLNGSVPFGVQKNARSNVKVVSHESPVGGEAEEAAYEGEDEHEETSIIKRDFSDFELQAHDVSSGKEMEFSFSYDTDTNMHSEGKIEKDTEKSFNIQSGHTSDPGVAIAKFWASPGLKRSCSNLETSEVLKKVVNQLPPSKCQSFEDMQKLAEGSEFNAGSPGSVVSHYSADKVMLKKQSSSQVLPSRSRRLWWKLLLWSHRNMHDPSRARPRLPAISHAMNQHGGYSSDTVEPSRVTELRKMGSPGSFTGGSTNRGTKDKKIDRRWNDLRGGGSGLWLQNQWIAVPTESSSFARVSEWVKDLDAQPPIAVSDDDNNDENIFFPPSPENGRSPSTNHSTRRPDINLSEEMVHANNLIQTLNSSSAVAHISGVGLKVIPPIACFSSLRSVNLSSNFIVHIAPGVLPKGLHTLNLSKNKISTIEGLRDLTRLRVLDLSYNRISKIGHGLSNCTLIKELYLAGNKISDVEGLHRLLKLTVLDLSFNKITTTKALGQLVANYNSLLALNLLGNPIQSNISDDQLRKAVCGLIPKLVYLNKQPIKPLRAREVLGDSVAKAALGNSSWSSRRKSVIRVSQGASVSTSGHRSTVSVGQKSRSRSKSRTRQRLPQRTAPSTLASTSH